MKKLLLLIFSINLITAFNAEAQTVPNTFEIKAKLLTNDLTPKTGVYKVRTTLWSNINASDILPTNISGNLWSEIQTVTLSDEGTFEIMVGKTTPLPSPFNYSTLKYYQTDIAPNGTENWQILDPAPNDSAIDRKNMPSVTFALNSKTLNGHKLGMEADNIPTLNESAQLDPLIIPDSFAIRELTSTTDQLGLFMDESGNVGVGTTTLSGKLSIAGDLALNGNLKLTGQILDSIGSTGIAGQVLTTTNDGKNLWSNVQGFQAPYITTSIKQRFEPNENKTITITGYNFTPNITVSIPSFDGSINSINVISPKTLELNITAGTSENSFDIILNNNGTTNTIWSNNGAGLIDVKTSSWYDLRSGGDNFTLRMTAAMTMNRDALGMYFIGDNPWTSFVKFENLQWNRSENKTLEWIFSKPESAMMIGIGSNNTNESSTSQYAQAEVEAYFTSSAELWGLYGNNGIIGNSGNQSMSTNLSTCTSNTLKAKFSNSGSKGEMFTLYCLPSSNENDWDDESNILKSFAIDGTLNPDEETIMPFIIPRSGGSQRFIALKIK